MQLDRLFKIVYRMLESDTITALELSEMLQVSVRTIYRDIETLSVSGIPIYAVAGKGGGYKLLDNFVLNKSAITEQDQAHIIMALQNLSAADHVDVGDTLSKMRALFHKSDTSWITVDYSRWGSNKRSDQSKFDSLKNAILERRQISFTYINTYNQKAVRVVYPLKLVFKTKSWYLQGYCCQKEDYRIFKINRMADIKILDMLFIAADYHVPPLENLDGKLEYTKINLKFHPGMLYRIYDEFDEKDISPAEDGNYLVYAEMPEDSWLYGYLLSFGSNVEVISPPHVKERLFSEVKKLSDFYLIH